MFYYRIPSNIPEHSFIQKIKSRRNLRKWPKILAFLLFFFGWLVFFCSLLNWSSKRFVPVTGRIQSNHEGPIYSQPIYVFCSWLAPWHLLLFSFLKNEEKIHAKRSGIGILNAAKFSILGVKDILICGVDVK